MWVIENYLFQKSRRRPWTSIGRHLFMMEKSERKGEEIRQRPAGFKPTTWWSQGECSTAALQPCAQPRQMEIKTCIDQYIWRILLRKYEAKMMTNKGVATKKFFILNSLETFSKKTYRINKNRKIIMRLIFLWTSASSLSFTWDLLVSWVFISNNFFTVV